MADLTDAEAARLEAMDADALVAEIAAMNEERVGLEAELRDGQKAYHQAHEAWGAASDRMGEHERRMAAAWDALRRRLLG